MSLGGPVPAPISGRLHLPIGIAIVVGALAGCWGAADGGARRNRDAEAPASVGIVQAGAARYDGNDVVATAALQHLTPEGTLPSQRARQPKPMGGAASADCAQCIDDYYEETGCSCFLTRGDNDYFMCYDLYPFGDDEALKEAYKAAHQIGAECPGCVCVDADEPPDLPPDEPPPPDEPTQPPENPPPSEPPAPAPVQPAAEVPTIGSVSGEVVVIRNRIRLTATVGMQLQVGDLIATDIDAEASLTFVGGTVKLLELTTLHLNKFVVAEAAKDVNKFQSQLDAGVVKMKKPYVNPPSLSRSDFSVSTPVATIGIRGSACTVSYDPLQGIAIVFTDEHLAYIQPLNGTELEVPEGYAVVEDRSGNTSAPEPFRNFEEVQSDVDAGLCHPSDFGRYYAGSSDEYAAHVVDAEDKINRRKILAAELSQ